MAVAVLVAVGVGVAVLMAVGVGVAVLVAVARTLAARRVLYDPAQL